MGNQNSRLLLEAASSGNLAQLRSVLNKADANATDEVGESALLFFSSDYINHIKAMTWPKFSVQLGGIVSLCSRMAGLLCTSAHGRGARRLFRNS